MYILRKEIYQSLERFITSLGNQKAALKSGVSNPNFPMTLISSSLANNNTGAITAQILRDLVIDIVDSCFNEPVTVQNVPPGTIIYVAMPNAPDGYLKANGQEVSRSTYANLFNAIGIRYGAGNGVFTFNLPDLRGTFIRCWSDGSTKDQGRQFASEQKQGICEHTHKPSNEPDFYFVTWQTNHIPTFGTLGALGHRYSFFPDSGNPVPSTNYDVGEVRPANIALLACIKY